MSHRNTILKELSELGSSLGDLRVPDTYSVPEGYFDSLAANVLARIRAFDAATASEEVTCLSPLLSRVSKENVYKVPAGYFESVIASLPSLMKLDTPAKDEIHELSPLLRGIGNKNPYTVPDGYFEKLQPVVDASKVKAKVVSMPRRIMQYAAAAVITGLFTTFALIILNNKQLDPSKDPGTWVEKKVLKKVDAEQLEELVTLADDDENYKGATANQEKETNEIKELMKDVSVEEIQSFLDETGSTAEDDLILN